MTHFGNNVISNPKNPVQQAQKARLQKENINCIELRQPSKTFHALVVMFAVGGPKLSSA
jgi:hypothetical protein